MAQILMLSSHQEAKYPLWRVDCSLLFTEQIFNYMCQSNVKKITQNANIYFRRKFGMQVRRRDLVDQLHNCAFQSVRYISIDHLPLMASNSSCDSKASMCPPTAAYSEWALAHVPGPCITNVIATCRKNFSQWESSFLWKLRCHWLKFLRRVAKTLVIQGPGPKLL